MTRSFLHALATAAILSPAAPAAASPNVFWTFGFDPGYGHGAGGRADAAPATQEAALLPPRPAISIRFALADFPTSGDPSVAMLVSDGDDAIAARHLALR